MLFTSLYIQLKNLWQYLTYPSKHYSKKYAKKYVKKYTIENISPSYSYDN